MESQQSADAIQRERYYATIHKGAGFRDVCEKIPGGWADTHTVQAKDK